MYKYCKKKLHLFTPKNTLWFTDRNGKQQRTCKKCRADRLKNSPARKALLRRQYLKKSARKLKYLNVTGIINGIMGCAS